ncbi:MAG: zinc ribbon domain-containing protein [Methanobrevibacter thaueri]|nr:zinc ribbon domain-containing protein [Methanobrevibacter thaueri]
MVKCKKCGSEVVGSDFCFNCGEKIEKYESNSNICPKCGAKNNNVTQFCKECGYKFDRNNGPDLSYNQKEWNARRDEIIKRYDMLAEEFGIKDEDYFLTSVRRFNKLEKSTTKHQFTNDTIDYAAVGLPVNRIFKRFAGNETIIDGFFIIKEDKFVFMEIDNREWEKVNAGINNFYFDKIVSMRVTKRLGDESRYEDITKRTPYTSAHDIKRAIQNDIQSLKATRFKDLITNNDSADMFDRLLIKLVDNTSFEIRLPSYQFGQNLIDLFETLRGKPQKVVIENQSPQPTKAQQIKEYQELLDSNVITQEEFDQLKQDLLFN